MCGKPRPRFASKLPRNHPAQVALEETISLRRLEHNHIARYLLDKAVYRLRRRIKILTGIAQAEFFLSNPRAPGVKKRGQQLIRGLCSGAPDADISFDPVEKGQLLTQFYGDLFRASECQSELPQWVRLEDQFNKKDLEGMPRIDGAPKERHARTITRWRKFCRSWTRT